MSKTVVSINETAFLKAALAQGLRTDGRGIYDYRILKISFGNVSGHCEVLLGHTRVCAIVTAEVVEPYPDRPTEGFFVFNTEFSPMASPDFDPGRPSDECVEISRVVERGLRESGCVDTEALCIKAGEAVWSIRCDIHILDHCGNVTDCASIATITALLHFRRPDAAMRGDSIVIYPDTERDPVPLSIHHIPISVTFSFLDDGEFVLVDPNFKEEQVMEGTMTITVNNYKEICAIHKGGGTPILASKLIECSKIAYVKVKEITQVIQKSLKQQTQKAKESSIVDESNQVEVNIAKPTQPIFESTAPVEILSSSESNQQESSFPNGNSVTATPNETTKSSKPLQDPVAKHTEKTGNSGSLPRLVPKSKSLAKDIKKPDTSVIVIDSSGSENDTITPPAQEQTIPTPEPTTTLHVDSADQVLDLSAAVIKTKKKKKRKRKRKY
eukprot:TRINITY_DN5128_c0_g1_i1.p1 TRINITY_DN5128_c0_g1~~TRINITY_DN5128_c0_g1_i1.p1  ORF type:complete len:441 (+),score=85.97 TRINITY_DN5128_c0_g1_i1:76-1398(+)